MHQLGLGSLTDSLLNDELLGEELHVVLDNRDFALPLLGVVGVLLSHKVEPEGGRSDLVEPILELFDFSLFLGVLGSLVARVSPDLVDVCLDLLGVVLRKEYKLVSFFDF